MGRLNLIERRIEHFMRQPPSVRNAAGVIVVATAVVTVGAGALISLIDGDEYPNVGIGLWWAIQTVTTVGYGDVAPKDVVGRVVAALVMLYGIAFIAIVTAVITSTFVARASRDYDAAQNLSHVDIASQVIANSCITVAKNRSFKVATWIALLALMTAAVGVVVALVDAF